ncbi:MAG: WbqC family protein [Lachnospiraceae bacterium]|nr:WbqC family protein [Lachnospiraceae bacterium]
MKVAIMQPYFFPYIGYWQLINIADTFVILDDVNYINRGWVNRNKILSNNGTQYFNLVLEHKSQNKKINEIRIADEPKSAVSNMMKIECTYHKAPFYSDVYPLVEKIISNSERNLAMYLTESIERICDYLNITTKVLRSSDLGIASDLKAQDRIIAIAGHFDADTYINPIGGVDLYSKNSFENAGVDLYFLKTGQLQYSQFENNFIPNLSIIDVMMFNSVERISEMLHMYELM